MWEAICDKIRKRKTLEVALKLTEYRIENEKFHKSYTFALISDLHGSPAGEAIELLRDARPDAIFAAGDIFERLDGTRDSENEAGFELLTAAAKIAPTYYSYGNHELGGNRSWLPKKNNDKKEFVITEKNAKRLTDTGVVLLDNGYCICDGVAIGGIRSGAINEGRVPEISWIDDFCRLREPKVLVCHHPEYYKKYLCDKNIDLIVSGHAHGGQWRFFGQGIFAPGQGIFPKYTAGVYENRLVVSRGMKEARKIPRIFNPTEVVIIKING